MSAVLVEVDLIPQLDDDDFVLHELVRELTDVLGEVGDARRVEMESEPDAKGMGEYLAGALIVAADPAYLQVLADLLCGFLDRKGKRSAHLRIGKREITIDQPTEAQVSELIDIMRSSVERSH